MIPNQRDEVVIKSLGTNGEHREYRLRIRGDGAAILEQFEADMQEALRNVSAYLDWNGEDKG